LVLNYPRWVLVDINVLDSKTFFSMLPVANQKAKYLVKKFNKIAKDQEFSTPFEFHNQGSLAYIGNWCVTYCFIGS
jgi:NADH dehydrogenase FAD-containing subunit